MHLGKIDPRPSPKVTVDSNAASIYPLDLPARLLPRAQARRQFLSIAAELVCILLLPVYTGMTEAHQ
jgi:hypothetical protein